MDLLDIGQKRFRLTVSWTEARILTQAMMTTLGGDIPYTEYQTRTGAEVDEVTKMVFAIQFARHNRRQPMGQFASTTGNGG